MSKRRQRSKGTGTLFKRGGRGPWIARWFDHAGIRREHTTNTTDKAAAERILAKRIADAALRRDGVVDVRADQYAKAENRPLKKHVADWENTVRAKGVSGKQVKLLLSRVELLLKAVKGERLSHLSASAIQTALGELHADGKSLQTCQHYLRAIKQFTRWLKRDGRCRDDVLSHLAGYNVQPDRQYERRALEIDELLCLIETTESGATWRQLSGPDRAMLYRAAAGTGFRASELRSLTPASMQLTGKAPTITLQAASSKRRRGDVQPIRPDLAAMLRKWIAGKPRDVPLWPGRWNEKAAIMIRRDFRRARAAWIRGPVDRAERRERRLSSFLKAIDADGLVVDFHSLRVTFITLLVKSGATVKAAQELARHSDPKLTMNIYSRLGVHDLAGTLGALPSTSSAPKNVKKDARKDAHGRRTRRRATGTDGNLTKG